MTVCQDTIEVFDTLMLVLGPIVLALAGWLMEATLLAECLPLWLLGQSGTVIGPILAYVTCTAEGKFPSFSYLTMSKFYSCGLIPSGCF